MNYVAVSIYSQGFSALLFLVLLAFLWMKYIEPAILTAQVAQNEQIALAERHRDEAKSALDDLQGGITDARRDASAITQRAMNQAQGEREAILREAREAGERLVLSAHGELARARVAARERLRDELLNEALVMARVQAAQRVDVAMNKKLVGSFLSAIEQRGGLN